MGRKRIGGQTKTRMREEVLKGTGIDTREVDICHFSGCRKVREHYVVSREGSGEKESVEEIKEESCLKDFSDWKDKSQR